MKIEIANKDAWKWILSFLSAKDFVSLSLTCRICFLRAKENQSILMKQFHLNLAVNQDIYLSCLYQNPEYLAVLVKQAYNSLPSQSSDNIKQFALAKYSLKQLLLGFFGAKKAQSIIDTINQAITQPKLPSLKLRREKESCETFSLYQMHLNNSYNRDDNESRGNIDAMIDESKVLNFETLLKEDLALYTEDDKLMILAARWYSPSPEENNFRDNECDEERGVNLKELETFHSLTKKISKISVEKPSGSEMKTNKKKKLLYDKLSNRNYSCSKTRSNEKCREIPKLVEMNNYLTAFFTSYCRIVLDGLRSIKNPFLFISEYSTKWKNYTVSMQAIGGFLREYTQIMNQVYENAFEKYANYPEFKVWRMMAKIWHNEVFTSIYERISCDFTSTLNSYLNSFGMDLQQQGYQILNEELCSENNSGVFLGSSEMEVSIVIGDFYNSVLDMALNERTIFSLTCFDLMKFGSAAGLCSAFHESIKNRCIAVIQEPNFKTSYKFELIKSTIDLVENFLPYHCFPEIYEVLIETLESLLTDFIITNSQSFSFGNFGLNLLQENDLQKYLGIELTDAIQILYPSLRQHLQYFRKKLSLIKNIICEREKKISDNALKGFSLSMSNLEKAFMDISGKVDMEILEECRKMYSE